MASSTKQFSLFLFFLITLSSSLHTHARDSQFFNKVSSAATNAKQPHFLPENENSYGLYAHDSSHLPPSTTAAAAEKPLHDFFPKNYNPVAYVTEAEDDTAFTEENSFTANPNNNYYYNGGGGGGSNSFNSQPQRFNGGGVRPEGMSDTRFMESGKYFYDANTEKYSRNHPYVGMRDDQPRNEYYNNNLYGKSGNAAEFNGEGYQNQDEFEDEVKTNLP